MEQILAWLTGQGIGLTDIVGILSIIAALTPTPVDDGVLAVLRKVLNMGALNIGQATPANTPGTRKRRKPPGK